MGILVAAHIDGQLKAVGVQIAEVIYACQWGVKKQSGVSLSMESEKIKWGKIQENEIKWKQCSLKHISSVYIYKLVMSERIHSVFPLMALQRNRICIITLWCGLPLEICPDQNPGTPLPVRSCSLFASQKLLWPLQRSWLLWKTVFRFRSQLFPFFSFLFQLLQLFSFGKFHLLAPYNNTDNMVQSMSIRERSNRSFIPYYPLAFTIKNI